MIIALTAFAVVVLLALSAHALSHERRCARNVEIARRLLSSTLGRSVDNSIYLDPHHHEDELEDRRALLRQTERTLRLCRLIGTPWAIIQKLARK